MIRYQKVWVAGPMGVGKTTICNQLSVGTESRSLSFDMLVEDLVQLPIKRIFVTPKELQFRKWELELGGGFLMPMAVNVGGGTSLATQNQHRIFRFTALSFEGNSITTQRRLRDVCDRPLHPTHLYWKLRLIPNKVIAKHQIRTAVVGLLGNLSLTSWLLRVVA